MSERLPTAFFERPVHELARDFLGRRLVRSVESSDGPTRLAARIVEVEVYTGGDDPASHAKANSPTDRTRPMFERPGTLYIYRIYGMWDCLNVTAEPSGEPAAILIRAAEPLAGLKCMSERRGVNPPSDDSQAWTAEQRRRLLSGPGKLCQAMAITPELDSRHIDEAPVWLEAGDRPPERGPEALEIEATPRIGLNRETVGEATDWPWRYIDTASDFLSR